MRDSSPKAFLVFYHPSVHAVIDLHGRMDEVEASAKASGHYPQRERQRKEHNTHTHLQIRGNQQSERRFSVKSGGGRGGIPAPKIQFSPSAPVSLVEIDELVRKKTKKKQIYEAQCVMAL